ncbi:MAG TPA: glycosyltransferase family 87 protein [Candidatus Bathyarchaeia archaeon]|nr:glycosyltransferase family 87 protein [Candidatus Bathyarchaeia archaeon]
MRERIIWSAGVVVAVLALGAAVVVASALPAGYDFRAYWLAGQHLLNGAPLYPGPDTILGLPDEFRYLPIVAILFVPFALLPYAVALVIWTALQIATAAAVGIALIRQVPPLWRPWAAAGFVFLLGLVLEVTLGNVNLLSLGLALAAWRFRERALPAGVLLAAAVGLKFLPLTLLLFYVASGRWRPVAAGAAIGVAALAVGALAMPDRTAEYVRFAPRLLEQSWVYAHIARPGPPELAAVLWSDWFPLVLAIGAVLVAIAAGLAARRDRSNENAWHALTLATAGYLAPFGYFWTTFLILSLPLAAETLRRASTRPAAERVPILVGVVVSWVLMEPQQTGTLVPILLHLIGVILLCVLAVVTVTRPAAAMAGLRLPSTRARTSQ